MSRWRHERAIAEAVAGVLPREGERKLLGHLRSCGECRRHYDVMCAVARVLSGRVEGTLTEGRRELERLTAALTAD
ncbi:MAG TPA: hypothetical protein VE779_06500 [Candidatus Angelobacter sp.]|nr:hypothetical protein [Candidatus Angelobacter sp.]